MGFRFDADDGERSTIMDANIHSAVDLNGQPKGHVSPTNVRPSAAVLVAVVAPDEQLREYFCLDALGEAGIRTEIWYVAGGILSVDGRETHKHQVEARYIRDLNEFTAAVAASETKVFIALFNFELRTAPLFSVLRKYAKTIVYSSKGAVPIGAPLIRKWSLRLLTRALVGKFTLFATRFRYGAEFDFVFYAGKASLKAAKARIAYIPVNAPDWERERTEQSRLPLQGPVMRAAADASRCVVFLDSSLPCHPDVRLLGYKYVDAPRYREQLLKLFSQIESQWNCTVRIAGHPRSTYTDDFFGGRPIEIGRTASLVRDSVAVITHASTSTYFAVMHRKPILVCYCEEFLDPAYGPHLYPVACGFSVSLKVPLQKLGADLVSGDLPLVNDDRYQTFEIDYVSDRQDQRRTAELFGEFLLQHA